MNFEDVVWMTIFFGMFVVFIKGIAWLIRYSNNYWADFVKCKHTEPGHDKIACEQFNQAMSFLWRGGFRRW